MRLHPEELITQHAQHPLVDGPCTVRPVRLQRLQRQVSNGDAQCFLSIASLTHAVFRINKFQLPAKAEEVFSGLHDAVCDVLAVAI